LKKVYKTIQKSDKRIREALNKVMIASPKNHSFAIEKYISNYSEAITAVRKELDLFLTHFGIQMPKKDLFLNTN